MRHLLTHIGEHLNYFMGSSRSFKTSAVMLSLPGGALFRFSRLMAALTSVRRMSGGGGVFVVRLYAREFAWRAVFKVVWCYRPLSRRLDRCDRVIQDESGDSNGGNW